MASHYRFAAKVFEEPYTPYYDSYQGHIFVIDHYHDDVHPEEAYDHVWLKCVDEPNLKVNGYVELDNLQKVIFCVIHKNPAFRSQFIAMSFEDYEDAVEFRKELILKKAEENSHDFTFPEEAEEWYDQCYRIKVIDFQVKIELDQVE